jgi:hypothetical protein
MTLLSLIIRLASGERLEKATPSQNRTGAFTFLFVAVGFLTFVLLEKCARDFMDTVTNASALTLWIYMIVAASAIGFAGIYWCRVVSTKVTVLLAVIAWAVLLGLFFWLRLWDAA